MTYYTEKKMIRVSAGSIYFGYLSGSIDDAIKKFQDLKTKGYEYFDECENYTGEIIGLIPYFQREETDAEYQERNRKDEIREANLRKQRRRQYDALRKEFGEN
jgi:hypothetical protein